MSEIPRRWLQLAIVFAVLAAACAARAEVVSRADLTTSTGGDADHFLVFCARNSEPWGTGHAFVVWIKQDRRTGAVDSAAYGYYPGMEKVILRLFTGAGIVVNETTKPVSIDPALLTHRFVVRVDREVYLKSMAQVEQWRDTSPNYNLLRRNCTHFAYDIGRSIGLDAPKPEVGEGPNSYLERVIASHTPVAPVVDDTRSTEVSTASSTRQP